MEQENSQIGPIANGAVVEATDGLVGTVISVITNQESGVLSHLVVETEGQNKQYTIPANLIASQVGSHVIHLSIPRDQLGQHGIDLDVDSEAGTSSFPMPPAPQ